MGRWLAALPASLILLGATLFVAPKGAAQMAPDDVFHLVVAPVGPDNPRNSEGAIAPLRAGGLLLGWTEFYAGNGADHGPARLVGGSPRTAAGPGASSTRWLRTTAGATSWR